MLGTPGRQHKPEQEISYQASNIIPQEKANVLTEEVMKGSFFVWKQ